MKIALISDTHNSLDPIIEQNLHLCDEIWHAGDIGTRYFFEKLESIKPIRAVFGNIDGFDLRIFLPEIQLIDLEGVKVLMTHIGGYPGRYAKGIKEKLKDFRPDLFISGHSHILKIIPDHELNLLHINPGAAGNYGFHKVNTMVYFEIKEGRIYDLKIIEGKKRNVL